MSGGRAWTRGRAGRAGFFLGGVQQFCNKGRGVLQKVLQQGSRHVAKLFCNKAWVIAFCRSSRTVCNLAPLKNCFGTEVEPCCKTVLRQGSRCVKQPIPRAQLSRAPRRGVPTMDQNPPPKMHAKSMILPIHGRTCVGCVLVTLCLCFGSRRRLWLRFGYALVPLWLLARPALVAGVVPLRWLGYRP